MLTAKFHDGYVNWNTTTAQNWNSMDVGPRRDLVGKIFCRGSSAPHAMPY